MSQEPLNLHKHFADYAKRWNIPAEEQVTQLIDFIDIMAVDVADGGLKTIEDVEEEFESFFSDISMEE